MGLSSQLASSSLARPGVCTSSTRPASPYEGQVIYTTDTDLLQIWNGSAWRTIAFATPSNGGILQVVTNSTTSGTSRSTTTYADTNLSATITPTSTSSKILVNVYQQIYIDSATTSSGIKLVRGSTDVIGLIYQGYGGSSMTQIVSFAYVDSPNTTSATTYKTQFNRDNGTGIVYAQPNADESFITLQEVAG